MAGVFAQNTVLSAVQVLMAHIVFITKAREKICNSSLVDRKQKSMMAHMFSFQFHIVESFLGF